MQNSSQEPALEGLRFEAFDLLESKVDKGMATLAYDQGDYPTSKTLVLRGFDPSSGRLRLYTDYRSNKVAALKVRSQASLMIWDKPSQLQIVVSGPVAIEPPDSAEANEAFKTVQAHSLSAYARPLSPGQHIDSPEQGDLADPINAELARKNFTVLDLSPHIIDVVKLDPEKHLRAAYSWQAQDGRLGSWQSKWLVP